MPTATTGSSAASSRSSARRRAPRPPSPCRTCSTASTRSTSAWPTPWCSTTGPPRSPWPSPAPRGSAPPPPTWRRASIRRCTSWHLATGPATSAWSRRSPGPPGTASVPGRCAAGVFRPTGRCWCWCSTTTRAPTARSPAERRPHLVVHVRRLPRVVAHDAAEAGLRGQLPELALRQTDRAEAHPAGFAGGRRHARRDGEAEHHRQHRVGPVLLQGVGALDLLDEERAVVAQGTTDGGEGVVGTGHVVQAEIGRAHV